MGKIFSKPLSPEGQRNYDAIFKNSKQESESEKKEPNIIDYTMDPESTQADAKTKNP